MMMLSSCCWKMRIYRGFADEMMLCLIQFSTSSWRLKAGILQLRLSGQMSMSIWRRDSKRA